MKAIMIKVEDKIKEELDRIKKEEGLGTQTATITYLIKYYFLTKKTTLDGTISMLDKVLDKIGPKKIPSNDDYYRTLEQNLEFWKSSSDDDIF